MIAGAVTSMGFLPQLVKGYRTQELEDVSYFMPAILAVGMFLWALYGVVIMSLPVIVANIFGICCCCVLILMKYRYS